jgi:hypothetical protein
MSAVAEILAALQRAVVVQQKRFRVSGISVLMRTGKITLSDACWHSE